MGKMSQMFPPGCAPETITLYCHNCRLFSRLLFECRGRIAIEGSMFSAACDALLSELADDSDLSHIDISTIGIHKCDAVQSICILFY